jgi:uncharacterized membrane protein YcaP (DUF421 family)
MLTAPISDVLTFSVKSAIVLVAVVIMYRLLGKRNVAQYNVYDLVTIIALSNAVQNAMTGGRGELAIGLASAFSLLLVGFILSRIFVKAPVAQRIAMGVPVLIASEGHVLTERMKREHISPEDLQAAFRQHGIDSVEDVQMAVLEVDGTISIVPKNES